MVLSCLGVGAWALPRAHQMSPALSWGRLRMQRIGPAHCRTYYLRKKRYREEKVEPSKSTFPYIYESMAPSSASLLCFGRTALSSQYAMLTTCHIRAKTCESI